MLTRAIAPITILIAAFLLTGCATPRSATDTPPADSTLETTAPAEPTLGVPFEVEQNDGTASITIVSATYGPELGGAFGGAADAGGFLVLDVLWETSEGTSSSNFLYFTAKGADGREGEIAIGVDSALGSGDVPVGDKVRGNVAFDIGAGPYTIIVTDQLLQEAARLTVEAAPR